MALQLTVPQMACSACGNTITKVVQTIVPNALGEADPKTKLVSVETQAPETVIKAPIATAGYPPAA